MEKQTKAKIKQQVELENVIHNAKLKATTLDYFFDNITYISEEVIYKKQSVLFAIRISVWAGKQWLTTTFASYYGIPIFRKIIKDHKNHEYLYEETLKSYFKVLLVLMMHGIYLGMLGYYDSWLYVTIYEGWVLEHQILNLSNKE